ncbi:HD domain-containing protein [Salinisphaera sp. RV14]|uniref:HD domain-containing protein n=1 Tax=unclassified Salinisphaera TaxID=2649847 RepID=UPI003F85DBF6
MTPSDVVHIDTHRIEKVALADSPSWHLLSRTWVPAESTAAFDRLTALLDRLTDPHVRALAHRLFISQEIAEPFLCVPASRSHHHAGIGGLLIHSVECAEMAESLSRYVLPTHERDLAVMGALLHDLAKIRIMKSGQVGRHAIYGVTQEALNLEVLAPFLKRLDREWPEGGAGLREILGVQSRQQLVWRIKEWLGISRPLGGDELDRGFPFQGFEFFGVVVSRQKRL